MEINKAQDYPNNYVTITLSSSIQLWIIWDALERMLFEHVQAGGQHVLEITTMINCITDGLKELYSNVEG